MEQIEPRRLLIPQFTIRWLLMVTTVCGGIFSIFGLAARGHDWAVGVSVAITSLVVMMLAYAFVFFGVWIFSVITSPLRRKVRSPFGEHGVQSQSGPFPSEEEVPAAPIILD